MLKKRIVLSHFMHVLLFNEILIFFGQLQKIGWRCPRQSAVDRLLRIYTFYLFSHNGITYFFVPLSDAREGVAFVGLARVLCEAGLLLC